ncbi:MAG TPA: hypothetical protein VFR14_14455 [Candidatus Limnocylindrales bacterium]|nr:hypothetical protein [Candidatus Limnocylindrales bacterium]
MHGTRSTRPRTRSTLRRADAITWIDPHRAIVARTNPRGTIDVEEFRFPDDEPGRMVGLAAVARAIGDRERILVLGPEPARTSLEREYVSIFRRPDRLVDVEPEGPVSRADLIALLREQAG